MSIANLFGDKSGAEEAQHEENEVVDQTQEANEPDQSDESEEVVEEPAGQTDTSKNQSEPEKTTERKDNGHFIPSHVALDWRDQNKEMRRQLAEYERREREAQQRQQIPDPANDPYAYAQYQQTMFQDQLRQQGLDMSHRFALQQHGQDVVDKATAWAYQKGMSDPSFDFAFSQQADPVAWVIAQYKQNEFVTQAYSDPDAYVKRRAMELGYIQNSETAQQSGGQAPLNTVATQPAKKLPGGTIASAPSAGKSTEPASGNAIGRMFNNK